MNKELDYDTHNDSIIRSMSTAPKMFFKMNFNPQTFTSMNMTETL